MSTYFYFLIIYCPRSFFHLTHSLCRYPTFQQDSPHTSQKNVKQTADWKFQVELNWSSSRGSAPCKVGRVFPAWTSLFSGVNTWLAPSLHCSSYPTTHKQVKEEKGVLNSLCISETSFISDGPPLPAFHAPCVTHLSQPTSHLYLLHAHLL